MNQANVDSTIQLADGRQLAYAEYGDADGTPVILFHGVPGSRLSWGMLPGNQFPPGLRLIAPDRPGYGRSHPKPGRTLLGWADDVAQLADALGIEQFAVVGVSGGGPGALACAWKFPSRLTCVAVVVGPAPTNAPGVFAGMSRMNRFFMRLAWRLPWLSNQNIRLLASIIRRNPSGYIKRMKFKLHDVDQQMLARPEIQNMLSGDFSEALKQGAEGMVCDMSANHGRPWGFALEEIKIKVHLWSCEFDHSIPPAMGKYLKNTIPDCQVVLVRGAGHLWILEHLGEVLTSLNLPSH